MYLCDAPENTALEPKSEQSNPKDMCEIRKISDLQPAIGFTEFDIFRDYGQSFLSSELGKLYEL